MEEDKDLRTLECLRGRLLAERQASRIAKEGSDLMGNKLIELENLLKQEIKLRNKAEKRLKVLKKKLESLNISFASAESDRPSSSEKSETSLSGTITTSNACASEENNESVYNDITNSVASQDSNHNSDYNPVAQGSSASSSGSNSPEYFSDNPSSKSDDNSSTDLRSSMSKNESDHEDCVDNSLALVPVSLSESSYVAKTNAIELKPVNENVAQVLDSLRYIRETIQSSLEMSRMVRVGPT